MSTGSINPASAPDETYPPVESLVNYEMLVTEDDKPVDNLYSAWQHPLLTVPLIESWKGPGEGCPRWASTDVGLFYSPNELPYSPDVFLSGPFHK